MKGDGTVNVRSLPGGIYIVKFITDCDSWETRVVKQ
jgi:hypothetical protein